MVIHTATDNFEKISRRKFHHLTADAEYSMGVGSKTFINGIQRY